MNAMSDVLSGLNTFSGAFFSAAVLAILALGGILTLLEWSGFLPQALSRFLLRNRVRELKDILKDMGVDFSEQKKLRFRSKLASYFDGNSDIASEVKKIIAKHLRKGDFKVGRTSDFKIKDFADLMSASCDPKEAVLIARCLSTYLKNNISEFSADSFDFVACPKSGSPFIAYEFAKILQKPLVLHDCHEEKYRVDDPTLSALSKIDYGFDLRPGMVGLVVDDSTTGGRKVCSLVSDLRHFGCVIGDCLVAFEPQGKNGKNLLLSNGVRLHSIVKR